MPNTSASGGYLLPSSPAPVENDAFEDLLGDVIAGISALDRPLVRPRWQVKPPPMPPITVNWCAFGVTSIDPDYAAVKVHNPDGEGTDEMQRHATVAILASFYGPSASSKASQVSDGLMVDQNRDQMRAAGVTILDCTKMRTASDLLNEQWVRRVDLEINLRRVIERTYPILNVLSASGVIRPADGAAQPFTLTET
ncbi:hypothetical protein AB4099_19000 [Bosea sp. 2KB_26]|uniref:phage neck terminator protein n=1 Tax=Bosea sp. 2KB_26 TaxID=3237475 RepID=UPI003F8EF73C